MHDFRRSIIATLLERAREPRRFIQVLAGPRQTGKTTLVGQLLEEIDLPSHYTTADDPIGRDAVWIEQQWEIGRLRAREAGARGAILVLDEVQKVTGWSEIVKRLYDADARAGVQLRVFVLGSAPLLVGRGLTESLAGRFEVVPVPHWSFAEMKAAFGWDLTAISSSVAIPEQPPSSKMRNGGGRTCSTR